MDKAISRRLAALQRIAARHRPAVVTVTFMDGSSTATDPAGAIGILRGRGACGEVDSFQTGNPVYSGWAQLLTVLLHPAPDRRIEDYET